MIKGTPAKLAAYERKPNGRSTVTLLCPYCDNETKAVIWSLAGTGKLCSCGAKFRRFEQVFYRASGIVKVTNFYANKKGYHGTK